MWGVWRQVVQRGMLVLVILLVLQIRQEDGFM